MSVPSILQTGLLKTPTNMNVETSLLYPVSITQKRAKFVFDRKGVLNSNSRLQLRSFSENPSYNALSSTQKGYVHHGNPLLPVVNAAAAAGNNILSLFTIAAGQNGCVVSAGGAAGGHALIGHNGITEAVLTDLAANPTHYCIAARKTATATQVANNITGITVNAAKTQLTFVFAAAVAGNWANANLAAGGVCEVVLYDMTKVQLTAAQDVGATKTDDWKGWTISDAKELTDIEITASDHLLHTVSIAVANSHDLVKADLGTATTGATNFGAGVSLVIERELDGSNDSFFPIATGAVALVQTATLEIGGRRISTLEEVGQYNTIKHLALSNEYREQVASVQEGVLNTMYGATGGATTLSHTSTPAYAAIRPVATKASKFSVALSDLIPMLKGLRLPLFLMEQEVALHIDFTDGTEGKSLLHHTHDSFRYNAGSHTIDTAECVVMADYLFFPAEMAAIESQINSGQGLSIPYDDILTINAVEEEAGAVAAPATAFINKIYSKAIALAGKRCSNVIVQLARPSADFNKLLGVYYSKDYQRPSAYNFIMDGAKPYYTNDIANPAVKYGEVSKCINNPLQISNQRYTFSNTVGTAVPYSSSTFQTPASGSYKINGTFEGVAEETELTGTAHYMGIDFTLKSGSANVVGKKFGNLPMFFKHDTNRVQQNGEAQGSNPLRFYCGIQKVFNISKGVVEVVDL